MHTRHLKFLSLRRRGHARHTELTLGPLLPSTLIIDNSSFANVINHEGDAHARVEDVHIELAAVGAAGDLVIGRTVGCVRGLQGGQEMVVKSEKTPGTKDTLR